MSMLKNPMINAIATKLSWLSARQRTLSQNIANANTPGYQARDLEKPDFENMLRARNNKMQGLQLGGLRKTNDKHLNVGGSSGDKFTETTNGKEPFDSKLSGNNVILEEQMVEMAQNQLDYATMINLYRRHVGLMRTSLGKK